MKYRLVGAGIMLDMPVGTMYNRFCCPNDEKQIDNLISIFKTNPQKLLELGTFEIYGDNSYSMGINRNDTTRNKLIDFMWVYDANIVGDASPQDTLYLIVEEEMLKDSQDFESYSDINDYEREVVCFSKNEILEMRDIFIKEYFGNNTDNKTNSNNKWARKLLIEYANKGCNIIYYDLKIKRS